MSAPTIFDVESWSDPLHRCIAAQAANINRIEAGLDMERVDGTLIGAKPDIIRLHDTPRRIQSQERFADAGLIVTLGPLYDGPGGGRIVGRSDRMVRYLVVAMIRLTREEAEQDKLEDGTDSPLARKVDAWRHDFSLIYRDNFHLEYDGCRTGLVDDADFTIQWDPDIQWPEALMVAQCEAKLYER